MGTGNLQTVAEAGMTGGAVRKKWEVNSALLPFPWRWYTGDWSGEPFWREQGGGKEMSSAAAVPRMTQQLGPGWCWWAGALPWATHQGPEASWEAASQLLIQRNILEKGCQSSLLGHGDFYFSAESSIPMLVCKPPFLDKKRLQPGKTTSSPPAFSQNCTLLLLSSCV